MNALLPTLSLLFFLCFAAECHGEGIPPLAEVDPHEAQMAGFALDEAAAGRLAARLEADPADHVARATLMAYEQRRTYADGGSPDAAARAHELAAWFVREHPGAPPMGFVRPSPQLDMQGAARLADLWGPHLAAEQPPLPVLLNAATFFTHADKPRSRSILERAVEAYPADAGARRALAFSWSLEMRHGPEARRAAAAEEALRHYLAAEHAAEEAGEADRGVHDAAVAEAAWRAGEAGTARTYAQKMVDAAGGDWNGGNNVYDGNRILGHLALEAEDRDAAVGFLDAAGASRGSPQLNSFGPDLSLAQALLDAGETEAVLRHLDAIGRFWGRNADQLERWSAALRAGVPVTLDRVSRG